jgi:hypothetical protein
MISGRPHPRGLEVGAALAACALAHALAVTGLFGLPMMLMAPAGEPFGSWWDYVGGAFALPIACGVLAGLLSVIVRLAMYTESPATEMRLRLEAKCLRPTPVLLAIGFALLSAAMFAGIVPLSQISMEVLAGEPSRQQGVLVLGGGGVLCALLAIGSGALFPVFRKRANSLDARRGTHCGQCGYDLSGLSSPTCPECGHTP